MLRVLLLLAIALLFLSTARAQQHRPVLEQVSNGPVDAPLNPVQWVRGACIPNNSHYLEGHYIPYRAVIPSVPLHEVSSIDIAFTVMQNGGLVSTDFLTSYNAAMPHLQIFGHEAETIDPLSGLQGPFPPKTNTPVPAPANAFGLDFAAAFERFRAAHGEQVMSIWNGEIQSIEFRGYAGQPQSKVVARYTVTFVPARLPVVIAWGGHIASPEDYGEGRTAGKGKTELLRLSRAPSSGDALSLLAATDISAALATSLSGGGMSCSYLVEGGKPINPTTTGKERVVEENTLNGKLFEVYPNPARSTFTVRLPDEGPFDVRLMDLGGRLVGQWLNVQQRQLQTPAIRTGVYLLEVNRKSTGARKVERVTVQ